MSSTNEEILAMAAEEAAAEDIARAGVLRRGGGAGGLKPQGLAVNEV